MDLYVIKVISIKHALKGNPRQRAPSTVYTIRGRVWYHMFYLLKCYQNHKLQFTMAT